MSTPTWLLDAIHATKSAGVLTVPNPENTPWAQGDRTRAPINTGFMSDVPTAPTVPKKMQTTLKNLGIVATQRECRHAKVRALLSDRRYAVIIEDDSTDPIIATVGIQSVATFEMDIPHHSYNGIVLLELLEKHL